MNFTGHNLNKDTIEKCSWLVGIEKGTMEKIRIKQLELLDLYVDELSKKMEDRYYNAINYNEDIDRFKKNISLMLDIFLEGNNENYSERLRFAFKTLIPWKPSGFRGGNVEYIEKLNFSYNHYSAIKEDACMLIPARKVFLQKPYNTLFIVYLALVKFKECLEQSEIKDKKHEENPFEIQGIADCFKEEYKSHMSNYIDILKDEELGVLTNENDYIDKKGNKAILFIWWDILKTKGIIHVIQDTTQIIQILSNAFNGFKSTERSYSNTASFSKRDEVQRTINLHVSELEKLFPMK